MKLRNTLLAAVALLAVTSALAQSNGEIFDAAAVLVPGMALQRGGVVQMGNYQTGLLQSGDVIYTANDATGMFHILTSDGSVIGINPATTLAIDGGRTGFDVFQVENGYARVLGNVNDGYPMPPEFSGFTPLRLGPVVVPGWGTRYESPSLVVI
jgi:hypothetical protein